MKINFFFDVNRMFWYMFFSVSQVRSSSTSNVNIQVTIRQIIGIFFNRMYDATTNRAATFTVTDMSTSYLAKEQSISLKIDVVLALPCSKGMDLLWNVVQGEEFDEMMLKNSLIKSRLIIYTFTHLLQMYLNDGGRDDLDMQHV